MSNKQNALNKVSAKAKSTARRFLKESLKKPFLVPKAKSDNTRVLKPVHNTAITHKDAFQSKGKEILRKKIGQARQKNNPKMNSQEAKLQEQLWLLGFYGDVPYEEAVDGIFKNKSKAALKKALDAGYIIELGKLIAPNKTNYTKSNSLYALAHRALLGRIYPYDYNPEISFDDNNVKYFNEFLTLDLNTPEGRQRALEIRQMKQENGKPLFSNRTITDNVQLLRLFRERLDLMLLNSGLPLQFDSYRLYTNPEDGSTFYRFTNNDINLRYINTSQGARKKYTTTGDGSIIAYRNDVKDENGNPIGYIPRDLTNTLFNQYSIKSKSDDLGNYTLVEDDWNLKPIEFFPGKSITPKIKITSYDNIHDYDSSTPEDFIIPNSVYSGDSKQFTDKEAPTLTKFALPFSLLYITDMFKQK